MAVLQVLKGLNPGQLIPLDQDRAVLGRHPDCDIVLEVGAVSRQHAQISREGDQFIVEDLASRNGTFVNGELVEGRRPLVEGDRLKICDLLFTFRSGGMETVSVPTDTGAMLVDDDQTGRSSIISKLDVSLRDSGLRVGVRPEVKLQAMFEITESLRASLQLDHVLPRILETLFKIFVQADRGFVVLRERPGAPLIIKAEKHRRPEGEEYSRISRTVINRVMEQREAVLSADAASDSRFDMSQSIADFRIRSMMCAPLIDSDDNALGVLQIDTQDQRSRFTEDDLMILAMVAAQAAIVVENAQLHEQALRQLAVDNELNLARRVQQGFLPKERPRYADYAFFDFYEPAKQVGGDYYDYIPLPGGRLAVILADVSGKGVPAALLMAKLSGEIRYFLASEPDLAAAITALNRSLTEEGWDDRFVTLVTAIIDRADHSVQLVNAGHLAPVLRQADGEILEIGDNEAGIPLAIDGDYEYACTRLTLAPGESLTTFTDGFSEAMNPAGDLYGLARLRTRLASSSAGVEALGAELLADVRSFVAGTPQSDDMCLVSFGRNAAK